GDVDADVHLVRPRGHVPVDLAHVVADLVRSHLLELGADAEDRGAVVACEQPFHAAGDAELERAQERVRQRARTRPLRGHDRSSHATASLPISIPGADTAARTSSRMRSGLTPSASAW